MNSTESKGRGPPCTNCFIKQFHGDPKQKKCWMSLSRKPSRPTNKPPRAPDRSRKSTIFFDGEVTLVLQIASEKVQNDPKNKLQIQSQKVRKEL